MGSRFLKYKEIEKFTKVLSVYQPSGQVIFDFANSRFGVIAGPTGSGKDTLRGELIKLRPDVYKPILSTTTRPPRDGEMDGVEYHFRDLNFIETGLDEKRFLQAELIHNQQISGLDFADIDNLDKQHFGIGILVVQAEKKLRHLNPELKTVFIVPPSFQELMRRIQASRSMKQDEIDRRIQAAKIELEFALNESSYRLLVNDDLVVATKTIDSFFQSGSRSVDDETSARKVIQNILSELSKV